jgi:nucleoid DNA-binding protein
MTKRIQKNEVAKRVASRLSINEKVSEEYIDAVLETLYEAFKSGESVTLKKSETVRLCIQIQSKSKAESTIWLVIYL